MNKEFDFDDIVLSVKSSDVKLMTESYRLIHEMYDYPLHLGVTEAGTARMGIIKSAAGIGSLLLDGIGDTIRVSLTADPVEEIYAAKDILKAVGIGGGVRIVSCPTCHWQHELLLICDLHIDICISRIIVFCHRCLCLIHSRTRCCSLNRHIIL